MSVVSAPHRFEHREAIRRTVCQAARRAVEEGRGEIAITIRFVMGSKGVTHPVKTGVEEAENEAISSNIRVEAAVPVHTHPVEVLLRVRVLV